MRDSAVISLQVTVAARSSLTVNLTYEELLTRRRGQYRHAISVDPGQVRWAAYPPGGAERCAPRLASAALAYINCFVTGTQAVNRNITRWNISAHGCAGCSWPLPKFKTPHKED